MRNYLLILSFLFSIGMAYADNVIDIYNDGIIKNEVLVVSSNENASVINYKINSYSLTKVRTQRGDEFVVNSPECTKLLKHGSPDLPKLVSSLIISDEAKMQVEILNSKFIEIENINIAPSKGNLLRTVDPSQVPYFYGSDYNKNSFFPQELAHLRKPYILRSFRGQTVVFNPFQYNPVTKTLRIYTDVTLKVEATSLKGENILNRSEAPKKLSKEFQNIYQQHFLNYNSSRYSATAEDGSILVICHPNFIEPIQPYVDWKIQKGIETELIDVTTIGTTSAAIKSYISNQYSSKNIVYILLVGDAAFVPTISAPSGDSDNSYGFMSGNDHYPELFVGRFSVETVDHVQTMVERVIDYELNADSTDTHFATNIGIGSDQGPGDDNEMDYEHIRNMQIDLQAYTYTSVTENFDGNQGGLDASGNPPASMIAGDINAGSGSIVYTGHGSNTSWGTSGFSNTNIGNLTNTGKLPFIWSVACVNGNFVSTTCFGEKWTRATYNNEPSGAIATLMSTINQSWDPPMCGQDEMVDILVESYANNIKRTFGGISLNGCMQMIDEYGSGGESMLDTWNIFGDPAIMLRTATPTAMTISHLPTVFLGFSQFQVNCDEDDALVSLTINNEILGTGIASGGIAYINFPSLSNIGTITITVTAYNKITYVGTIDIVPNNGPYIVLSSFIINDPSPANNNGLADYTESISLDLTLNNIGVEIANNVSGIISSSDNNITITNNSFSFGNIDSNAVLSFSDIFGISIANNVSNQHVANFSLELTDDLSNTWTSSFNLTLNAPELEIEFVNIDDSNGNSNARLDPGETVNIIIDNLNTGFANSLDATCSISSLNPFVSISNSTILLNEINAASSANAIFVISVDSTTPMGTNITFDLNLVAGEYSAQLALNLKAGLTVEDWESNDFNSFSWEDLGYTPWTIDTINTYEGSFAARSGVIADNGTSVLSLEIDVISDDSISFYKKVSCEPGVSWGGSYYYYDYLEFYIDNNSQGKWGGEIDWSREAFAVTSGIHSFTWVYKKDQGALAGEDAAFIDFVVLPAQYVNYNPFFSSIPVEEIYINETYNYEIITADPNTNQTFTIEAIQKPVWLSFYDYTDGTAMLTGIAPSDTGTFVISLKVTDNEGASGIQNYNLVVAEDLSAIDDYGQLNNFVSIYPNPVCEKAFIDFDLKQKSQVKIEILNSIGTRIISFDDNEYESGSHMVEIDCENFPSGIYFCSFLINNVTFVKKFCVIN